MKKELVMKVASTIKQVKENKNEARNGAANNSANNRAHNKSKTNSVEISKKSEALAKAANTDKVSNGTETQKETTTATQSEPKVEEATKQVTAKEKSENANTNARQAMKQSQSELSHLVKGLKEAGMSSKEVGKIVRTANREANKVIGREIGKAYKDYRGKKISRNEFTNKLYGAAVKKLDGIVSALKNVYDQKVASAEKNTEAVKETANETKSDEASGANKETRVTDADDAAKAAAKENTEKTKEASNVTVAKADVVPPGQIIKAEKAASKTVGEGGNGKGLSGLKLGPINANENADKAFSKIIDFFNDIDKMVNGFADEAEGKGSNDEEDGQSLVDFASKLSDMFSDIDKAFGSHSNGNFGHKLGMAQAKKGTISQLFGNGHGNGHSSGNINRIGDNGEGSGNFNAVSFMASLSNTINDGLESYRDVQKAEKESKEEAKEVDGATNDSGKINSIEKGFGEFKPSRFNAVRFMSSLSSGMNSVQDEYKEVQETMGNKADKESEVDGALA